MDGVKECRFEHLNGEAGYLVRWRIACREVKRRWVPRPGSATTSFWSCMDLDDVEFDGGDKLSQCDPAQI